MHVLGRSLSLAFAFLGLAACRAPAARAPHAAAPPTAAEAPAQAPAPASGAHSLEWWQGLRARQFAPPPEAALAPLVDELCAHLGDLDPEWREHVAVDGLVSWILRSPVLDEPARHALVARLSANLRVGIGSSGDERVLLRSFSALMLSILAAADNQQPFLAPQEHDALLADALEYLAAERDVRGHDPRVGWMHSVAHTADLLKFLARSPHFDAAEQQRTLAAIGAKLRDPRTGPLDWGEPERLARAVLSITRRPDFERAAFESWVAALGEENKALWQQQPFDEARFHGVQNERHFLAGLASLLVSVPPEEEGPKAVLEAVLKALWA